MNLSRMDPHILSIEYSESPATVLNESQNSLATARAHILLPTTMSEPYRLTLLNPVRLSSTSTLIQKRPQKQNLTFSARNT